MLAYDKLDKIEYHRVQMEIAEHATNLLWGQGYSILILKNGKEDKLLNDKFKKIEKDIDLQNFLLKAEFNLSYYGQNIVTIDKLKSGKIRLGLARSDLFNAVGKINIVDDIGAVIFKQIKKDTNSYLLKEYWTNKYVKREIYGANGIDKIKLYDFNIDIPEDLQVKEYEEHNLGILPVLQSLNIQRDINTFQEYRELSDTYKVENLIHMLNLLRAQEAKEAFINTTKVFGNFSNSLLARMKEKNINVSEIMLKDLFIEVAQGDAQTNKMVEIAQASPAFSNYDEAINNILKHIWRGSGYTYIQSGDTMSGNAETLYANASDIRTTKAKRTSRQLDYALLVKKILLASNLITLEDYENNIDIVFNIKENIVQSSSQVLNSYLALYNAGMISKVRVIQKIEQLNTFAEAKAIVQEAEEEQKELQKDFKEFAQVEEVKEAPEDLREKETQNEF